MFLPNRYTRANKELLGKNLVDTHTVDEHTRGIRCRKSPRIHWPGRPRKRPTNFTRLVTAEGSGSFLKSLLVCLAGPGVLLCLLRRERPLYRAQGSQTAWRSVLVRLSNNGQAALQKYLGKSTDLSLARLEYIAAMLQAQSETHIPPPVSLAAPSTDGEVDVIQRPRLAQRNNPLHPLLATKLHMPRPRAQLVSRAHLVERLQQGLARLLTLVSAPAGFGKTTLLAQWSAESGMPVVWLSLEAEDNDSTRFLSYLIAALQTLDAQIGTTALALLRTPQPAPPEVVLAVLTNDIVERGGGDFTLVLDDYHVISADSVQRGMTFLLEHLPPRCVSSWPRAPTHHCN